MANNYMTKKLEQREISEAMTELRRISEQPAVSTHYARVLCKYITALEAQARELEQKHNSLPMRVVLPKPLTWKPPSRRDVVYLSDVIAALELTELRYFMAGSELPHVEVCDDGE